MPQCSQATELMRVLKASEEKAAGINVEEAMFGWAPTKYQTITKMVHKLEPFNTLWLTTFEFYESYGKWMNGPFSHLNAEEVGEAASEMYRKLYKLSKAFSGVSTGAPALDAPMKVADEVRPAQLLHSERIE